jgi:hypothetical protein
VAGDGDPLPRPSSCHVELLRRNGRGAWIDRLLRLGLKAADLRATRREVDLWQPIRSRLVRF